MKKTFFTNSGSLFKFLGDNYKGGSTTVDIATYGMYLGISQNKDWHPVYPSEARSFVERVAKDKLRLLVGMPYFIECTPHCKHCKVKYNNIVRRHIETISYLKINAKFHSQSHLKFYRVGNLYVAGGINLGNSNYADASFVIQDPSQQEALQKIFDYVWDDGESKASIYYKR